MLKNEAFAYFGVELHNLQCAWSGRNEELNKVVFSVYPCYLDMKGSVQMYRFHRNLRPELSSAQKMHGLKWLVEDFRYGVEHTNRIVHCVWLEPFQYGPGIWVSNPEHTAPCTHMLLELVGDIDENTGYFEAKVLWLPIPIQPERPRDTLIHRTPGGQELHFHS